MDPLLIVRLRSRWPLLLSGAVLLVFAIVHTLLFQPVAKRYQDALARAGAVGAALRGSEGAPALPPRVFTLLMTNSLPANEADQKGASGALGAELVQQLSAMAGRHGLEVVVAEPGVLSQMNSAVEVRAHLKVRGGYAGLVGLLDEMARGGRLILVERFSVLPATSGRYDIELWVSSCLLRRQGGAS